MRLIDADNISFYCNYEGDCTGCIDDCKKCENYICNFRYIQKQPTAYDVDKVVEELKETMQDLSVIEILSHIDFDSTIQSGLDNFLKAYNSELLRIVRQGVVSDDVCEWEKGSSGYVGYPTYYSKCCATKSKGLEMQSHIIADWKYCPYCGKKIKIVGD